MEDLGRRFADAPPRVTLLMGEEYAEPLRGPIRFRASEFYAGARWPARAEEPLRGVRTIGLRVRTLEELNAVTSAPHSEGATKAEARSS